MKINLYKNCILIKIITPSNYEVDFSNQSVRYSEGENTPKQIIPFSIININNDQMDVYIDPRFDDWF